MTAGPLAGIRVLEFSLIVAGPACGINLSDLGADVIKVEPPGGEPIRQSGAVVPNESKAFQAYNRGKRGIIVDLADPRGLDVIYRLVPQIDVVTNNYRPGVAERLGIDYETLARLRPDLIYLAASGFGASGPASSLAGSDIVAQAYSGLMAGNAKVDEHGAPETISASPVSDYGTALGSAMGICAALFHRERTGEGQLIQSSLLRSALFLQANAVMREPVTDAVTTQPMLREVRDVRARRGTYAEIVALRQLARKLRASMRIFYGGYRARDGGLVLGALTPATRDSIRRILGLKGERSDDPDFDATDPENQAGVEQWLTKVRARLQRAPRRRVDRGVRRGRGSGLRRPAAGRDGRRPAGAGRGDDGRARALGHGSAAGGRPDRHDVENADRGAPPRSGAGRAHARGAVRLRLHTRRGAGVGGRRRRAARCGRAAILVRGGPCSGSRP